MLVGTGFSATVRPYEVSVWHLKTWLWGATDKLLRVEHHRFVREKEVGKVLSTTLGARRFCSLLLYN